MFSSRIARQLLLYFLAMFTSASSWKMAVHYGELES